MNKIKLLNKTSPEFSELLADILVSGKIDDTAVDFFIVYGHMTKEYIEAIKETVTKKVTEAGFEVTTNNAAYFAVTRADGTAGCARMVAYDQYVKGIRWEDKRPNAAVLVNTQSFSTEMDRVLYSTIFMAMSPLGSMTVEVEIDDGAK